MPITYLNLPALLVAKMAEISTLGGHFGAPAAGHDAMAGEELVGHGGALLELLHAVFAQVLVAELQELADLIGAGGLGDGDGEDVGGLALGSPRGVGDLVHDALVTILDLIAGDHRHSDPSGLPSRRGLRIAQGMGMCMGT